MLKKLALILVIFFFLSVTCLASIKGKVLESNSSNPLALVKIELLPGNDFRLTDRRGNFSFQTDEAEKLIISRIGYKSQEVKIDSGNEFLLIALEPETVELAGIKVKGGKTNSISEKVSNIEVMNLENDVSNEFLRKLETDSGIFIQENAVGEKQISINGCKQKQIVIMVDGVKINNRAIDQSISHIPASLIDKIELAKGSNSVVGGSSAIGGIVNFILKNPKANEDKHTLTLGYGSWNSFSGNYQGTFHKNNLKILLNLHSATAKNNFSYYNEIEEREMRRQNNGFTKSSIQLKLNHPITTQVNHLLSFFVQNAEKGIPGQTTDYMYYKDAKANSQLSRVNSKTVFEMDRSIFKLNFNLHNQSNHYENKDSDIFHKYDSKNFTRNFSSKLEWDYSNNKFSSSTGINFRYESYRFDNLLEEGLEELMSLKIRRTISFMENNKFKTSDAKINYALHTGLRFDSILDEDNIFSADLGLTLQPKKFANFKFLLNVGSSYRLPEFTSLFWKGDSRVQGNPELEPERAKSAETEFKWQNDFHKISFAAFINKIDKLIYWHRSALGIWTPDNLATAEISGITAKIQTQPWEHLSISSNFTRIFPINKTKSSDHYNNYLIYKPLYKWVNNLQFFYNNFSLFFKNITSGKQYVNLDNKVALAGYSTWDVGGSFQFKLYQKITSSLNFTISNLFSESYQTYRNIPAAGRGFNLNFEISL